VDAVGNVYVTDTGNHAVQKFTTPAPTCFQWGSSGSARASSTLLGHRPTDASGCVYVADEHVTSQKSRQRRLRREWGVYGHRAGQFHYPEEWPRTPRQRLRRRPDNHRFRSCESAAIALVSDSER